MLDSNSATVTYLDIANEADGSVSSSSLGACTWSASTLDSFIASYLGPDLSSAGLSSVKIVVPSSTQWFGNVTDISSTCLNDSSCAQYVYAASAHGYGFGSYFNAGSCCSAVTNPGTPTTNKAIWMSEINGGYSWNSTVGLWSWDASMTDALEWARMINDYLTTASASGWLYWQLADCCSSTSGAPFNDGLTDGSFNTSKRYYVVGQWSKFVRSGWTRIDATVNPVSGVYVTAFTDPSGTQFAFVAVNDNPSAINLPFSLVGFPSVTSVTPTLTSASADLADQPAVNVSGGTFSYSLPATSVVTFHGSISSSSSQPPTPPTNVTAIVQ